MHIKVFHPFVTLAACCGYEGINNPWCCRPGRLTRGNRIRPDGNEAEDDEISIGFWNNRFANQKVLYLLEGTFYPHLRRCKR